MSSRLLKSVKPVASNPATFPALVSLVCLPWPHRLERLPPGLCPAHSQRFCTFNAKGETRKRGQSRVEQPRTLSGKVGKQNARNPYNLLQGQQLLASYMLEILESTAKSFPEVYTRRVNDKGKK